VSKLRIALADDGSPHAGKLVATGLMAEGPNGERVEHTIMLDDIDPAAIMERIIADFEDPDAEPVSASETKADLEDKRILAATLQPLKDAKDARKAALQAERDQEAANRLAEKAARDAAKDAVRATKKAAK